MSTDEDVWKRIDSAVRVALNRERPRFDRETKTGLEGIFRQSWQWHDATQRSFFAFNTLNFCGRRIEDWRRLVHDLYLAN